MCPPPNGTQLPTSSAAKPQPTIIDPLAALWVDATTRYENDTRTKLSSPSKAVIKRESNKGSFFTHNATLDSADAVFDYVREHEASFKAFREGGAGPLLHRLRPIAKVVTTLSGIIGEAVGIVSCCMLMRDGRNLTDFLCVTAIRSWKGRLYCHRRASEGQIPSHLSSEGRA